MQEKGFTLIELVIVIIILGLLSAVAIPRFIELQPDARTATLKGLRAEMHSVMNILYPKAVLQGLDKKPRVDENTKQDTVINIDGVKIVLAYGYPAADSSKSWSKLILATFTDSIFGDDAQTDWYFHNNSNTEATPYIRFMTATKKNSGDNCYLKYTEAKNATTPPVFEIVNSGC